MKQYFLFFASLATLIISCSKKDGLTKFDPTADKSFENALTATQSTTSTEMENTVMVITLAGGSTYGDRDGTGANALFNGVQDITKDQAGNLYVADFGNGKIKKITPSGVVTTLPLIKTDPTETFTDVPSHLTIDGSGNLFFSDRYYHHIRKVNTSSSISTFAGNIQSGFTDGQATQARFFYPGHMAKDESGNIYVVDQFNYRIRKITPSGLVSTFAGSGENVSKDGRGTKASFRDPRGITIDRQGYIYVTEQSKVRKISPDGRVTTLAGGENVGDRDGRGSNASFTSPSGITIDQYGNLYVGDRGNFKIKKITPSGLVTTIAGTGGGSGPVDGPGTMAKFYQIGGITIDASGHILYVTDYGSVRKITF